MRLFRLASALSAAAVLSTAAPAAAHHSFAMYDQTNALVLKGVIRQVQWTNPHVVVFFEATGAGSAAQAWTLELTSPGNLKRIGWSRTSLPVGQPIELTVNPLRDGQRGGALKKAVLKDGTVLTADWLRPGG